MKRHFVVVASLAVLAAIALGQGGDLQKDLEDAFKQGIALRSQGKFDEAIQHLEKALALAPKVFGPDHINTAGITNTTAFTYATAGKPAHAEKLYLRGLELYERSLPKNHPKLAQILGNLSATQDDLGKYAEAETAAKRALAIQEAQDPPDEMEIALTLNNYASLLSRMARYGDAEPLLQRCVELREKKLGKDHPEVAHGLGQLAGLYRTMRRDKDAETFARRALEIRVAKLGPEHLEVSMSLMELGVIAFNAGQYFKAEKYLVDAIRIRTKHVGKDHPSQATGLHNLALVYNATERVGEAEAMFLKSIAMREAQFGPDHPQIANGLSNLAVLYSGLGRYEETEKLLLRSLKIWESKSPGHPQHASALNNLAGMYQQQMRLKEAKSAYERSLAMTEARFGKNHIELAAGLNNLGVLYKLMNNAAGAIPLLQRALKISDDHYGPDHPNSSHTYMNLALAYWQLGDHAKADQHMTKSHQLLLGKGGAEQSLIAAALHNRAEVNYALGRRGEALKLMNEGMVIRQKELGDIFSFSSESAMYTFAELTAGRLDSLVNMAQQDKDVPTAATQALEWTLRSKGVVLDTLCRYRQAQLLLPKDDALQERVARYRTQKEFLANLALNPPTGKDAPRAQKQMADAEQEVAQLEKELAKAIAQKVPGIGAERDAITVASLRERLGADGALIEFLRIAKRDFKRPSWGDYRYVAFVLTPGKVPPRLIDLGPAKEIDEAVEALRKEFTDFQDKLKECESADEIKTLEKAQEKQFAAKSASLHARLITPFGKELSKASMLYLAPDGALNRLPFEALVGPDGKYLVEHHRCAYLSCGRDLLRTAVKPAKGTIVFANPDFKLDAEERLAQAEKLLHKKPALLAMRGGSSGGLRSAGWKSLPGAAAEAKDIQKILQDGSHGPVKAYVGTEAIEEVLKAMPAPRVLHLATHGFFIDKVADAKTPDEDGAGAGWARGRLKRMDNPLLRSGIVLAGANTIGDKDALAKAEDGWVTAEEIALLNLNGTELVVLSACQTGLGDIKSGEGVQGMRRAFLYAGAQTLVTSLFEVPDTETRELMTRFYGGLKAGQGKLRSLHSAQRRFIDERRKTHGAAHPFFWASFVLVGNPE